MEMRIVTLLLTAQNHLPVAQDPHDRAWVERTKVIDIPIAFVANPVPNTNQRQCNPETRNVAKTVTYMADLWR